MPELTEPPVLDEARLRGFTGGDPELERELAELFVATAGGYLAKLAECVDHAPAWRETVHALKGAAGNFGAVRLHALAQLAEQAPPCPETLAQLRDAYEAVLVRLRKRGLVAA